MYRDTVQIKDKHVKVDDDCGLLTKTATHPLRRRTQEVRAQGRLRDPQGEQFMLSPFDFSVNAERGPLGSDVEA